jgi:hypothetical protein
MPVRVGRPYARSSGSLATWPLIAGEGANLTAPTPRPSPPASPTTSSPPQATIAPDWARSSPARPRPLGSGREKSRDWNRGGRRPLRKHPWGGGVPVAVTITLENSNNVLDVDRETFARASVLVLGLLVAGGWRGRGGPGGGRSRSTIARRAGSSGDQPLDLPFGEDRSRVGKAAADLVDHGTLAFDGPVLRVQGDVSAKLDHDLVESEKGVAHVLGKSAEWVGHRGVNVPAPVGGGAARSTRFGCDALPALRRTCVALTGRWAARRRPGPVAAVPRWREVLPLPLATPRARIESPPCWLAVREAVPSAR